MTLSLLLVLVLPEDDGANFNTLTAIVLSMRRIHKGAMGDPPCSAVLLAVVALDESDFIDVLAVQEIPLVSIGMLDAQSFSLSVRIDEADGDQFGVGDRVGIRHAERILQDLLDGTPDVDDAMSCLEETVCFLGKMMRNTASRGSVGLVNVHTLHGRASDGGRRVALIFGDPSDGVVKDMDAGGASAAGCKSAVVG